MNWRLWREVSVSGVECLDSSGSSERPAMSRGKCAKLRGLRASEQSK